MILVSMQVMILTSFKMSLVHCSTHIVTTLLPVGKHSGMCTFTKSVRMCFFIFDKKYNKSVNRLIVGEILLYTQGSSLLSYRIGYHLTDLSKNIFKNVRLCSTSPIFLSIGDVISIALSFN